MKKKHLIIGRIGKIGAFICAPTKIIKDAADAAIEFDKECADLMAKTGCTEKHAREFIRNQKHQR